MGKRRDQVRRLRPAEVHFYRKFRNFLQTAQPTPDEIAGIYRGRYADVSTLMSGGPTDSWGELEEWRWVVLATTCRPEVD